jgi:hypothetical protein
MGQSSFSQQTEMHEIDIIEHCGEDPCKHHITYHYQNTTTGCNTVQSAHTYNSVNFTTGFHTLVCEFNPQFIKVFCDGTLVRYEHLFRTITGDNTYCGDNLAYGTYLMSHYTPTVYQNLIINLALCGFNSYCNQAVNGGTPFPSDMEIDYVKVYQQNIQNGLVDLCLNRFLIGDNRICANEIKEIKLEGPHGNLIWSTTPNLEIISQEDNSIKVQIKNNANSETGEIFLTETNSPCGSNLNLSKGIQIGTPQISYTVSTGNPNDGYCNQPIKLEVIGSSCDISINNTILPPQSISLSGINSPYFLTPTYTYSYMPISNDYCYPLNINCANQCGNTKINKLIQDNCIKNAPCDLVFQEDADWNTDKIKVYPNPTRDAININFLDDLVKNVKDVTVYNPINVSEVYYRSTDDLSSFDMQIECYNWPQGLYYIKVKMKDESVIYKSFIKKD